MIVGVIAGLMAVPSAAEAAWEQYINEEFHFGVDFPAEPSVSSGIHRGAVSGERPSTIFEAEVDGITYRVTVVDISDQLIDSGSILEEAVYIWGLDGELTVDMSARTGPWEGAVYGRRLTIDKEDGSRATASFFTTRGRLYIFEVSIAAGGDLEGPNPGRFVQTVIYNINWDWSVWPPVPRPE
jgi:hypothetical protein